MASCICAHMHAEYFCDDVIPVHACSMHVCKEKGRGRARMSRTSHRDSPAKNALGCLCSVAGREKETDGGWGQRREERRERREGREREEKRRAIERERIAMM